MNEIEKELKLSKRQNKNDRYNYLCSQFNCVEYAMKLEKYSNKLKKENNDYKRLGFKYLNDKNIELQQQLKDKDEKISKVIEYCLIEREDVNGSKCDDILEILESNKED